MKKTNEFNRVMLINLYVYVCNKNNFKNKAMSLRWNRSTWEELEGKERGS